MIKVVNESVNPYWFVNYDYDGDTISDYQSTVLVQAKDEQSALSRAKKLVTKNEPSARSFQIRDDRKLGKSTTLAQFRKTYPLSNYEVLNESVHDEMENEVTPVAPSFGTPVDNMQDIPANAIDSVGKNVFTSGDFAEYGKDVDLDEVRKRELDYTDPKYQKIVKYLNDNGYPGSKFLGKMGFYIPQHTSYVSIVFDNIFSECSIMTSRFRLSPAAATEYQAELTQVIDVVEQVNAILADATDGETKDRHVSESCEGNVGIIEAGNQNFGKPGTYILYRNGAHQTKRGFIGFTDTKAGADKYAKDGRETEKFAVTITNPYVSKGDSSFEAFASAYKDLVGSDPVIDPTEEKINDSWRKYDSEMAKQLAAKGYDSLIYIVPQNNEVNVLGADIDKMPNINEYHESVPQALGTE